MPKDLTDDKLWCESHNIMVPKFWYYLPCQTTAHIQFSIECRVHDACLFDLIYTNCLKLQEVWLSLLQTLIVFNISNTQVFWVVVLYHQSYRNTVPSSSGPSSPRKNVSACLTLTMKVLWSFKMSGITHPVTQHHIPRDLNLEQYHCENWDPTHLTSWYSDVC